MEGGAGNAGEDGEKACDSRFLLRIMKIPYIGIPKRLHKGFPVLQRVCFLYSRVWARVRVSGFQGFLKHAQHGAAKYFPKGSRGPHALVSMSDMR
jgi:hypothetical protein